MGAGHCSQVQICNDVVQRRQKDEAHGLRGPVMYQEKTYATSKADEDTAIPISVRSAPPTEREPYEPIWTERRGPGDVAAGEKQLL